MTWTRFSGADEKLGDNSAENGCIFFLKTQVICKIELSNYSKLMQAVLCLERSKIVWSFGIIDFFASSYKQVLLRPVLEHVVLLVMNSLKPNLLFCCIGELLAVSFKTNHKSFG